MRRQAALLLCIIMCICTTVVPLSASGGRDISVEEGYAIALKELGLFQGVSDTDFDLDRAPTRVEALVMLIRVLGKEQEALNGTWRHPFDDVPTWANPYVGYAYVNGLTNGISDKKFGSGDATAATYLTFVLRALGYSDVNGADFTWDDPFTLARTVGIFTDSVNADNFWRADVAAVSYFALSAKLKGSADTLADKLISANVFTMEQYGAAMNLAPTETASPTVPDTPASSGDKLTAVQISEKCAPAVFYIEVYGYNGKLAGTGSGFFISEDGYAITNFHVAANSSYMVITTIDGKKYDGVTVIDASKENDLALMKVSSDVTFPYLEIGNSDDVKQGQSVYAIGSPRGLENTLSQGIISNTSRTVDEMTYIQISVPIDSGSSGGALIDEYGKVIAVTTAGIVNNTADLNLAVPINKSGALDKNNTEPLLLWDDYFYPTFTDVYEFGKFTGIDMISLDITPLGYYIEYDASDIASEAEGQDILSACLDNYKSALTSSGFTVVSADRYTTYYESESERVTVINDTETKAVIVIVEFIPVYYAETEGVPDFGWYSGITCISNEAKNGTYSYRYEWADNFTDSSIAVTFAMYLDLLEYSGYSFTDKEIAADGEYRYSFVSDDYKINCYFDERYVTIEVLKADAEVETYADAVEKLRQYLISNGRYDAQHKLYDMEIRISGSLYDITYFAESSTIHFNSETSEAGAWISNYIYLNKDGSSYILLMYDSTERNVTYRAGFDTEKLSSNISLNGYGYTGAAEDEKSFHDMAVTQSISTLKKCEELFLSDIGITLADLGFTQLD